MIPKYSKFKTKARARIRGISEEDMKELLEEGADFEQQSIVINRVIASKLMSSSSFKNHVNPHCNGGGGGGGKTVANLRSKQGQKDLERIMASLRFLKKLPKISVEETVCRLDEQERAWLHEGVMACLLSAFGDDIGEIKSILHPGIRSDPKGGASNYRRGCISLQNLLGSELK